MTDLSYLMFLLLYVLNIQQKIKQILFCLVVWAGDLMHQCFWNSQPSYIIIKMGPFTTYQHSLTFSCSRKGSKLLFHVTSPSMYANHCKTKKWHVPKIIRNRDIAIWSFIFVLIWKQNVHLILLLIANNVIYVNFCFWAVFSHISWFEIHCIVGVQYVIYISGDTSDSQIITAIHMYCTVLLFTMIFVALPNRYMWKVQNSTISEG